MTDSEFDRRKELSFLQAEGLENLPQMLRGPRVTKRFKTVSLSLLRDAVGYKETYNSHGLSPTQNSKLVWVNYFCEYEDEIPRTSNKFISYLKSYIQSDAKLLNLLEYCARQVFFSPDHFQNIEILLNQEMIGYRFIGEYGSPDTTLVPISDEFEAIENQKNFSNIIAFEGAKEHFLTAVKHLQNGHFRGSADESINAVESVLKSVTGDNTATLGDALKILSKKKSLNPALKLGLDKIYGSTNGPDGIRHALSDNSRAVTESEAMFMFSACIAYAAWIKREAQTPEEA